MTIDETSVEATAFAASIDTETPQITLPASVETRIETESKPYTAVDPQRLIGIADDDELDPIGDDAYERFERVLESL